MNVLFKKRISRYLTVLATATVMTACTTTTTAPEDVPPAIFSVLEADSAFYLDKDAQFGNDVNSVWQFLAVQALIKEKKFVMADAVITSLQAKVLPPEELVILQLLVANNFYAQNKLIETQEVLRNTDYQLLSEADFVYYLKLQITLHISNELALEASESLLLLTPRLTLDAQKQAYNEILFTQLLLLPTETLTRYQRVEKNTESEPTQNVSDTDSLNVESSLDAEVDSINIDVAPPLVVVEDKRQIDESFRSGWYALASFYQNNRLRPNRLTRLLDKWKLTHPEHDALQFMPVRLNDIVAFSPYRPDNIGVLLPLSGRYEKPGKAVQLGLLNAYYHQQKEPLNQDNAFERTEEILVGDAAEDYKVPKLHFFDTNKTNSEQLAAQLKAANIDFVIGPLMKKEIEALLPRLKNMPVLALNSFAEKKQPSTIGSDTPGEENHLIMKNNSVAWHYAFPLSPESEARQAATMIYADLHKNPLIIVPKSSYGERVADAFKEQWSTLTPESNVQIEAHYFQSKAKLNTFIADVLQTDKSKRRINQMRSIVNVSLETEVRSRRDIDAIYIVSKRDELILLKPFIDVSVSPFAQKIPLYASSRSHSFDRNSMQNKELSRLVFSDNPFLLDHGSTVSKEVEQVWNKQSFATLRLFALGFDSYQLIEQLVYLQNSEGSVYKGLIGDLTLDADNSIDAKLSWAKYQDGVLFEITSPITAE